jgi:hypothetical protein
MKKKILPLFCLTLSLLTFSGYYFLIPLWSTGANILKPVRAGNFASYSKNGDGWLIIVSGRDQNEAITKTVQRYKVSTNSWDTLAPHSTGLLGGATTIVKDTLYVIGGVINPPGAGISTVAKYNITTDTWSTGTPCPIPIVDAKAVAYQDSLIYIVGGFASVSGVPFYVYNTVARTWRQATTFSTTSRRNFGGFSVTGDTLIYMCGTEAFGSGTYYDSVHVGVINQHDRSIITWTRGAQYPGQTRSFFDAASWGNRGVIMTGGSTDNTFNTSSKECYTYSPARNIWTRLPDKPTSWLTGQMGSVKLNNGIWKLICASGYGTSYLSVNEILSDTLLGVGINNLNEVAEKFALHQNYPNPFNPETKIKFSITQSSLYRVSVHNSLGKEVAELVNSHLQRGVYELAFNGTNFSSGVYFYKLTDNNSNKSSVKKMLLVK